MSEEKSSLLGPRGQLLIDTRPVGGRLRKDDFREWREFKRNCSMLGLHLSPDGMHDLLKLYNGVNAVTIPIARECGLAPIEFRDSILQLVLHALRDVHNDFSKLDSTKSSEQLKHQFVAVLKMKK